MIHQCPYPFRDFLQMFYTVLAREYRAESRHSEAMSLRCPIILVQTMPLAAIDHRYRGVKCDF